MLKRRYIALILILLSVSMATGVYYYAQRLKLSEKVYSGFWRRGWEAVSPDYEVNLTKQMASNIQGSSPGVIWLVGRIARHSGTCTMSFPSNEEYKHIFFETQDTNEEYLKAFDNNGIKVWLEVEPGFADITQLIDLVLKRYGNHSSVLGFAVDLEWRWGWPDNRETVPVTDEEANRWLNKTKSYGQDHKLFLIHWRTHVMPPTAHEEIVFIDDGQDFEGLESLVNEFKLWGENFSQRDVGYIVGYRRDLEWVSKLENPPREIGSTLIQNIPNCRFVFWSQETIWEVFQLS